MTLTDRLSPPREAHRAWAHRQENRGGAGRPADQLLGAGEADGGGVFAGLGDVEADAGISITEVKQANETHKDASAEPAHLLQVAQRCRQAFR